MHQTNCGCYVFFASRSMCVILRVGTTLWAETRPAYWRSMTQKVGQDNFRIQEIRRRLRARCPDNHEAGRAAVYSWSRTFADLLVIISSRRSVVSDKSTYYLIHVPYACSSNLVWQNIGWERKKIEKNYLLNDNSARSQELHHWKPTFHQKPKSGDRKYSKCLPSTRK
jgi:hypothetical protein